MKNFKKLLSLILMLTLVLSMTACASKETTVNNGEADTEKTEEAEKNGDIVILFTSDIHCGVDQGFGLAGLYSIRETLEEEGNYTILVDDGDAIQGEPIGTMTNGESIIDLMNAVGYDIAIPGNHEFDYGMDRFLELTEKAKFRYISCNFNKEGELVFDPYVIKEINGKKIGFVGVTTPHTLTSSTPKYFQDENGNFIYGFMQDTTGEKLYSAVQSAVDAAIAAGAEYIVAMGHMGNVEGDHPYNYADVIANTTGIDVFLDGHSHDTDQVTMKNKDGEDVLRSACGTKMQGIGYARISSEDGSITTGLYTWNNKTTAYELFGLNNDVRTAVDKAIADLEEKLGEVVAKTAVELTINDPEATASDGTPIRIIRCAETNLGDLCADAYRDQLGADIAFANGGGIRVSIPKGDITLGDILKVHPFGNMLCLVEVTGKQVLDALEWGARNVPEETGAFLHVSGLTYEIHVNIPSSCTADENGMFTGVAGEYRVKNVMIGGEPLDLNKTYKLASHNYMLKNGGDGFSMFAGCNILLNEVMIDNQALINYIVNTLGGVVGEGYEDPYGEGRIRAIED